MTPKRFIALVVLEVLLAAVWLFGGTPALVPALFVVVAAFFAYAIGRFFFAIVHKLER